MMIFSLDRAGRQGGGCCGVLLRSGEAAEQMRRCCARSRPRVCACVCVCVAFGGVRDIFLILFLFD